MAFVAEPHSNARTVLITLTRKAPLSAKNERINLMSKKVFLEFEKALGEIDAQIEKLENDALENGTEHQSEIARLEREMTQKTAEIYRELTPWQTALVARHPNRPYTLDYVDAVFEDFHELHGDRTFADDQSIIGGLARLGEHPVMVIGHQKGRDTRERTKRNFGMSRPEGYRKALRLMKLAEKFGLPVFTFVDTPGAYPGIGAEERNQSEAIGRNILEMSKFTVPVIATIIGEGGSGGALAIAVADVVLMLQYATYSVISPEGCASILWKSADKAPQAAEALALTSDKLLTLGLVDKVIPEPLGGAHRDPKLMAAALKKTLIDELRKVMSLSSDELRERRLARIMSYGRFETVQTPEAEAKKTAETLKAAALTAVDAVEAKAEDKTEAEPAAKKPAARKPRSKKADEGDAGAAAEPVKKAAAKKSPAKPRTANKAAKTDAQG